ncbi:hypothetical protein SteCoe_31687 [Stentor coeruleus]|uniref:Uncharacterized protein n=1 Tax=Stentor coeruleus TaxID=5963 RepID=A0A1R2B0Y9_9CILI|nr:hypothetical protein SteCoe_31687 [Stentor coeruleus]
MDLNLERERMRIRNFISKLSSSLAPSISFVKQPMKKFNKHKKTFSFESQKLKEIKVKEDPLNTMIEKESDITVDGKRDVGISATRQIKYPPQHLFTFQTLREMNAINHEFQKSKNYKIRPSGLSFDSPNNKSPTTNLFFTPNTDHNKITKGLPGLKYQRDPFYTVSPGFLKIVSRNTLAKNFNETQSGQQKTPELRLKNNKSPYNLKIKSKKFANSKKDSSFYSKRYIASERKKKLSLEPNDFRSRIMQESPQKTVRNSLVVGDKSNYISKVFDEDLELIGWEKATPWNMLDNN